MEFSSYKNFLVKFLNRITEVGIDVSNLEMDHLAYKTSSDEEYFKIKPEFLKIGTEAKESIVRGRRVSIFKLNDPWIYKEYKISAVELIAPLQGERVKSGWEHAEFVLKERYEDFIDKYPSLNWDRSVMNAENFSMIKLKLTDDMQVKFHQNNILRTVEEENLKQNQ